MMKGPGAAAHREHGPHDLAGATPVRVEVYQHRVGRGPDHVLEAAELRRGLGVGRLDSQSGCTPHGARAPARSALGPSVHALQYLQESAGGRLPTPSPGAGPVDIKQWKGKGRNLDAALGVVQGCGCGAACAVICGAERRRGLYVLHNSWRLLTGQVGGLNSDEDGSMSGCDTMPALIAPAAPHSLLACCTPWQESGQCAALERRQCSSATHCVSPASELGFAACLCHLEYLVVSEVYPLDTATPGPSHADGPRQSNANNICSSQTYCKAVAQQVGFPAGGLILHPASAVPLTGGARCLLILQALPHSAHALPQAATAAASCACLQGHDAPVPGVPPHPPRD